jgi:hypothetical protein
MAFPSTSRLWRTSLKGLLRLRGSCMSFGRRSSNEEATRMVARQPQRRRSISRARCWGEPRIPPSSSDSPKGNKACGFLSSVKMLSTHSGHPKKEPCSGSPGTIYKRHGPYKWTISYRRPVPWNFSNTGSRSLQLAEIILSAECLDAWDRLSVCLQH